MINAEISLLCLYAQALAWFIDSANGVKIVKALGFILGFVRFFEGRGENEMLLLSCIKHLSPFVRCKGEMQNLFQFNCFNHATMISIASHN